MLVQRDDNKEYVISHEGVSMLDLINFVDVGRMKSKVCINS